ncbi:MAG: hypothetical protein HN742_00300 [Lentisphaerae bacterium]|jgi:hypothetical protein|nr:hypothetical protein [Lentisphaerota bacterium]MBT4815138.1 hypothetical protein [Lentisphaerota bacterium]MBT5608784.1 hypothetical protein [Lentisphaerota bacterium]MBT7058295.1 hypothetical protein [Lentisphaerota bacterium]MBT7840270.1 hypothetical protein [Lentisphaerota bacterium]
MITTPELHQKSRSAGLQSETKWAREMIHLALICCGLFATGTMWGDTVDNPPAPPAGRLIPGGTNGAKYLCVFGPKGDKRLGATESVQAIWIRARRVQSGPVTIHVFDPGSGSGREVGSPTTKTAYTVYGGRGAYTQMVPADATPGSKQPGTALASAVFGAGKRDEWVGLGQFGMKSGEAVGENVYFKLVVAGLTGGSANLFRLAISPPTVDVFTYALNVALPRKRGRECKFYVAIPPGSARISEHNFDMDGMTACSLPGMELESSRNGRWAENELTIPPSWDLRQRVAYQLVKTKNADDNMSAHFTDALGTPLAIYFAPGPSRNLP